ncbi:Rrf2 family transcriptional regulator [Halobacteriovorax marinus]|uniref:Rrf2 family transcriptional regulator n=1 Tax=Halobacteriovorax marinus TaxID=97084 RepID=A0A1Y5F8K0_9BACT|nr:Rrf2 family transcriptional regulator [Halobacteriovorax marinus]
MRLTNFTDYSLRVLIYLAVKGDELSTVSEISGKYDISNNHLVKVVHNLSKMGIINTYKGKSGGINLALEPSKLNIGKLIRELEEDSPLVECFSDKGNCKLNPACKLKAALSLAKKSFYETLETFTLADMVKNKANLKSSLSL